MRGIVPALGVLFALAFAGARAEERPPIHAEEGSVAIGGNVSNSTIGVPYEKLEEAVRSRTKDLKDLSDAEKETNALLKEKLDLNQRQVKSALEIVGEANVPPERLGAKLVEIAERFKDLQTAAAAQPGDDSKITALKAEAQKAIQDGQLGEADEILAAIEKIQTEALDRLALNAAQTTAQRGDVALTRLRYPDAAQRFAEAAAKVPQGHEDDRWKYLNEEADALYRQGDEFGDNAAAALAIERYRHLAELWPRNAFPLDWAMTQMNLGNALRTLGERESGTARLEEAVAAYREALQENTRARVPLEWAKTQGSIGTALARLGSRESGTARLEEAVAAFREALQEFTRARVPLQWAMTQMNLGNALQMLGWRESGTARLEEAVAAHREALQENTRARVPLQWAMTQMNLGNALETLGERESGTAKLQGAVAAYREALQENTRARTPLDWAKSTGNQGGALMLLAERRGDAEMAKRAVQQIEAAFTALRDGGDAPSAAYYEARLPKARALAEKLAKR
jgi:tetratricopeptide (TPR) repeat protein